mmetsp:Transcript_52716/g.118323  ORF Transcript_52716/g.118323 Transcript_52716/m.118323 type:complete len:86 (-) Transcript_52716:524-781(-)
MDRHTDPCVLGGTPLPPRMTSNCGSPHDMQWGLPHKRRCTCDSNLTSSGTPPHLIKKYFMQAPKPSDHVRLVAPHAALTAFQTSA